MSNGLPRHSSIHPAGLGLLHGAKPFRLARKGHAPSSWRGWFSSHKTTGAAPYESLLERDAQTLFSADASILRYAVQPHRLTYWTEDRHGRATKRTYTPDFALLHKSGALTIVDVKARAFAQGPAWIAVEPFIRRAYTNDHNAKFVVLTEFEIRLQPRLANCEIILTFRATPPDPEAEQGVRDALDASSPAPSIGFLLEMLDRMRISPERAYSAIMRFTLSGNISLDLSKPISNDTPVVGSRS